MKKVAIFDDCITSAQDLEQMINEWIKEEKVKVLSIDVKTNIIGCVEKFYNNERSIENSLEWTATVVYDEDIEENCSIGNDDDAVHFILCGDNKPCVECGDQTNIEVFESDDGGAGGQRRLCAKCIRDKFKWS